MATLPSLPDRCLLNILSYLSIDDATHFNSTCRRFSEIYRKAVDSMDHLWLVPPPEKTSAFNFFKIETPLYDAQSEKPSLSQQAQRVLALSRQVCTKQAELFPQCHAFPNWIGQEELLATSVQSQYARIKDLSLQALWRAIYTNPRFHLQEAQYPVPDPTASAQDIRQFLYGNLKGWCTTPSTKPLNFDIKDREWAYPAITPWVIPAEISLLNIQKVSFQKFSNMAMAPDTFLNFQCTSLDICNGSSLSVLGHACQKLSVDIFSISKCHRVKLFPCAFDGITARDLHFLNNKELTIEPGAFQTLETPTVVLQCTQSLLLSPNAFNGLTVNKITLQFNQLTQIPPNAFNGLKAHVFYLSNNRLTQISREALNGLTVDILDLSHNQLIEIAKNTFTQNPVQALYLYGNKIKIIFPDAFQGLSLTKTLDLSNNQLTGISQNAFNGLVTCTLDLSKNGLREISQKAFNGLKASQLNLSDNPIKTIAPSAFHGLTLKSIDLSYTQLEAIPQNAFNGLVTGHLDLSNNQLKTIHPDAFKNLSVQSIDLSWNPCKDQVSLLRQTYPHITFYF